MLPGAGSFEIRPSDSRVEASQKLSSRRRHAAARAAAAARDIDVLAAASRALAGRAGVPALPLMMTAPGAAPMPPVPPALVPLAASDLMWARLPGPAPLPTGVLSFSGRVSYESAAAFARDKLFAVPAFARHFATNSRGALAWQSVSEMDVTRHLRHHVLNCSSQDPAFFAAFGSWCQEPLQDGQLPWDIGLVDCTDRSLIFARIHHAVTDGPGMMQALLSCHDDPDAWQRAEKHASALTARHLPPSCATCTPSGMMQRATAAWAAFAYVAVGWFTAAANFVSAAWAIGTRSPDRSSSIKAGGPVAHLRYAQVPGRWPLETLKHIAQARGGGTVNDVVVAAITGALRDVLAERGDPVDTMTLRAMHTVNMPRKSGTVIKAGSNNVGLAMGDLPISAATPHARFAQVHAIMQRFKSTAEPGVAARAMGWVARLPQAVIDFMHRRTTSQCSVLISNVMGPPEAFVLDGQVAQNMFWASPRFGDVGVIFPVISYDGAVQAAVQVDAELKLDPAHVAARVQAQFEALRAGA